MMQKPPKWARRFLHFYCKAEYLEEIEEDLTELFEKRIEKNGLNAARRQFVWDVIRSFRWLNIKKLNLRIMKFQLMRNYIKIGGRNIRREWKYSLLNFSGLSLGLAVFLLLIFYVQHEFSFDQFHEHADRTFRIIQVIDNPQGSEARVNTSINLASALKEELPMVEDAANFIGGMPSWVGQGEDRLFETGFLLASPEFFQVFDFDIVAGRSDYPISEPNTMVITETSAMRYFNSTEVIGESLDIERYGSFRITAVMKDPPKNSYLQFNMVLSQDMEVYFQNAASWFATWFESWNGAPAKTYIRLSDSAQKENFEAQLLPLLKKYKGPDWEEHPYYLQNILDQHLHSDEISGTLAAFKKGDLGQIRAFSIVAVFLLIVACFNYINLATARATKRAKEVGVRKTVGAQKGQLIAQFLTESFLIIFISLLGSAVLLNILLPYFEELTQVKLNLDLETILQAALFVFLTILLMIVLGGLYPAFYLSKFNPIHVLKNEKFNIKSKGILRHGLVSFQFALVLFMMIGLLVINQQMNFMAEKDLGFDSDHQMVVEVNGGGVRQHFKTIKEELLAHPNISNVSGMTRALNSHREPRSITVNPLGKQTDPLSMDFYGMDEDGLSSLGLELLEGRNFEGVFSKDSASVFLNEAAAKILGEEVKIGDWLNLDDGFNAQVIGILKDFHYRSFHERIGPLVLGYLNTPIEDIDDILVKVKSSDLLATVEYVEKIHNQFDENKVMTMQFLDEMVQGAYQKEVLFRRIFSGAVFISLFIALLGVVGLAAYTANAKTKDFGIRKVLGASELQIMKLQWRDYLKPLIIALVFASSLSWIFLSRWLENFAYRIELGLLPILFSFLALTAVTLLTIFGVGYKVTKENPVKALKTE